MNYDLSELKKLPDEEKLQIIDELWQSIDNKEAVEEDEFDEHPDVASMLKERIEKYERGEGVFYSTEEARSIIVKRLEQFRKSKNE